MHEIHGLQERRSRRGGRPRLVRRIRTSVESTRSRCPRGLGGFGGVIRLPAGMRRPLLCPALMGGNQA